MFFWIIYIPIAILLGRWDYKRILFQTEHKIIRENSPLYIELFNELDSIKKLIYEGKNKK